MTNLTMRNLRAHKRRLLGTGLAVILGVAFLAATLVLGDTMRSSFQGQFDEANAGTDLVVRNPDGVGSGESFDRGPTDMALADELAAVDGVAVAVPRIEGQMQIEGADGDPLGGGGPPMLAGNWVDDGEINPWRIVAGRAPGAADEVVIDRGSATDGDLHVGDTTTVRTPEPHTVEVVGIAAFGDQDSLSSATFVAYETAAAQALLERPGEVSNIALRADEGVSPDQLRRAVAPVIGDQLEALTGQELADEQQADLEGDFLGFVTTMLLVFAVVALVVATFSIYNTFAILVAQRTRESALLRAVGASRRQVLASIALEALAVAVVASAMAVGMGIVLATGLKALLDGAGLELAVDGVVVESSAIVISMVVGVIVTVVASIVPAIKASRVPPVAALRDVAVDASSTSRVRAATGIVLAASGVGLTLAATRVDSGAVRYAGLGALLAVVGAITLGPVLARPVAGLLGSPAAALRGATGRLARRNAMRNPRRTSASAMALLVGVTVVALFATLGASIKTSVNQIVDRSFGGDLVIDSGFGSVGLSPAVGEEVAALDEVEESVPVQFAVVTIDGEDEYPSVADPAGLDAVMDLDVSRGSLRDMAPGSVAISEDRASDDGLALGDQVPMAFADGARADLTVGAIYGETDLFGDVLMTPDDWAPHAPQPAADGVVLVGLADGVSLEAGKAAVQAVADAHAGPDVQTRDEYLDTVAGEVDQALFLVYGLLGLAVLIALMGIANTLSLAIHERTRELGLLRAVGQSRSQVRSTVRWESVIVSVFGTVCGVALGSFLGWGVMEALASSEGFGAFTLPTTTLGMILGLAALAGVVAAIRPARRAARLDILPALAAD